MQTVRTLEKMVKNITTNICQKLISVWGESYTTFVAYFLFGLLGGIISALIFGWEALVIGTGCAHLLLGAIILLYQFIKWLHCEYVKAADEMDDFEGVAEKRLLEEHKEENV